MCGIVGYAGRPGAISESLLTSMRDTIAHRGPDAGGVARGEHESGAPLRAGRDQYIFSSSWQASLKARNGSGNPWPIDCLIPENVVFSLA